MELNHPVFQVKFKGNVKDRVKEDSYVAVASYEAPLQETVIFVRAPKLNEAKQKQMGRSIKEHFSQYGVITLVKYYSNGADIIHLSSNN